MITWDPPNERYYEHGLDHGVLYIPGKDPIAWNGLTGFDEGGSGSSALHYRDGVVFLADADASDFSGKMSSIFFPDAFHECIGIPEATDGLYVDNQKPKRFGLSYRSLIGNGASDDLFGYQIHLVYNCMATIAPRSRNSLGGTNGPVAFDFDIVCTPVKLPGYRPTAHYIIDTRNMAPSRIAELEAILYGDGVTPGELPDPLVLYDLMNYGDAIVVTLHNTGYFTVEASSENVYATGPYSFAMKNINGTDDGDGYYTLSDGGNTDVIIEP
jgi:hypothetical protein